jgi:hypothetical protein
VTRLSDGAQLVEEHVGCRWSQTDASERKITISPLLDQRANIFTFYENLTEIQLDTVPAKKSGFAMAFSFRGDIDWRLWPSLGMHVLAQQPLFSSGMIFSALR